MTRLLRLLTQLVVLVALMAPGLPAVVVAAPAQLSMAGHEGMADCPHGEADKAALPGPGGSHPNPAVPASLPLCCHFVPSASGITEAAVDLPERSAAHRPHPVSDREPTGASPGPELPPPRA